MQYDKKINHRDYGDVFKKYHLFFSAYSVPSVVKMNFGPGFAGLGLIFQYKEEA